MEPAPAQLPGEEAAKRMRNLSDLERLMYVTYGVLEGKVLDLRPRLRAIAERQFYEGYVA